MREFERGDVGVLDRKEKPNKSKQIQEFAASDERFSGLSGEIKDAAIKHATFFAQAPEHIIRNEAKELYANRAKTGGFNYRETQNLGSLQNVEYTHVFEKELDAGKSIKEAGAVVNLERRKNVASRVARNEFSKILGYAPGPEDAPVPTDYKNTIAKPEFIAAETLVREAVAKFS